jgi:hypothetical protein
VTPPPRPPRPATPRRRRGGDRAFSLDQESDGEERYLDRIERLAYQDRRRYEAARAARAEQVHAAECSFRPAINPRSARMAKVRACVHSKRGQLAPSHWHAQPGLTPHCPRCLSPLGPHTPPALNPQATPLEELHSNSKGRLRRESVALALEAAVSLNPPAQHFKHHCR